MVGVGQKSSFVLVGVAFCVFLSGRITADSVVHSGGCLPSAKVCDFYLTLSYNTTMMAVLSQDKAAPVVPLPSGFFTTKNLKTCDLKRGKLAQKGTHLTQAFVINWIQVAINLNESHWPVISYINDLLFDERVYFFSNYKSEVDKLVVGDGSHKLSLLFNGSLPGPSIVVYEGQQVTICSNTSTCG